METLTRICAGSCGRKLSLEDFPVERRAKHGRKYQCKDCTRAYYSTPERKRLQASYKRKSLYGITEEEFLVLFEQQDSKCAGCDQEYDQVLDIDHNHETGEVRGLLCRNCNRALGLLGDDPDTLERLFNYLQTRG